MSDLGRILIADDEETFLYSTTELLRAEGYDCVSVSDAILAEEALKQHDFDALIADIKMPGNADLELVQSLPRLAAGMPVILVTGYPTVQTAIESIHLPVVAYLLKPVDFDQLLSVVKAAVEYSRIQRTVQTTRNRLQTWQNSMRTIETSLAGTLRGTDTSGSVDAFLQLTQNNILQTFGDLVQVTRALSGKSDQPPVVCTLMDCPRLKLYTDALEDAVKTLERTKSSFKSKELGELRKRLEELLENDQRDRNGRPQPEEGNGA